MAGTKTIPQYTAAVSIDAINDQLLIYNNGLTAYRKINRNTLLGITGAPVGTTDTQTLSGKTLTTPTINGATLSGTLSGTYTLGGTPTFPATVLTTAGTQTATNKTLTSPVINGGSIDNSTITVDSISGHTTGTIVTVGGVQLNNGTIGTANAVTSNAIAAGAVTPNSLVASSGTGWTFTAFTPTWTNLTVGNGTNIGYYIQIGKMVFGYLQFTFGNISSINSSGAYFNAPIAANARNLTTRHWLVGQAWLQVASANYLGQCDLNGNGVANTISVFAASGTQPAFNGAQIATSVPAVWATGNWLSCFFSYEAA